MLNNAYMTALFETAQGSEVLKNGFYRNPAPFQGVFNIDLYSKFKKWLGADNAKPFLEPVMTFSI